MRARAGAVLEREGRSKIDPLEELFRTRYAEFVALATVIVHDRATAEEVVQDAFVSMLRREKPLDDPTKLGGYVAQSVVNGARDRLRRKAVELRPRPADAVLSKTQAPSASEASISALLELLEKLPARQAQCLVCRYVLNMSHPEVATTLGISVATAKTHVQRGTAQLATWMAVQS